MEAFSKSLKIILLNNANFDQGKKVNFHLDSGKKYPFSALLSGKKGRFLTKSQGKYLLGTAGNPGSKRQNKTKKEMPESLPSVWDNQFK